QLDIKLDSKRHHLGAGEAVEILARLFDRFNIREKYRTTGMNILGILTKAEIRAHREFDIIIKEEPCHHHHHENADIGHHHGHHEHHHEHHQGQLGSPREETFLHEAQDIVIDIMGAVMGMQLLDIEPKAELLAPVSVGGGHVHFSHGTLSVPAPATSIILAQYGLPWKKGPIEKELFTPTGAAILAALGAQVNDTLAVKNLDVKFIGTSRGAKILDIPPLKLLLY
ncbi:MAG TPA: nickel insertion protein, partial [Candidatus Kapabacteria bacterium]|nr:nickel insertion protein [Candidatus Kapabacteria bacterium]